MKKVLKRGLLLLIVVVTATLNLSCQKEDYSNLNVVEVEEIDASHEHNYEILVKKQDKENTLYNVIREVRCKCGATSDKVENMNLTKITDEVYQGYRRDLEASLETVRSETRMLEVWESEDNTRLEMADLPELVGGRHYRGQSLIELSNILPTFETVLVHELAHYLDWYYDITNDKEFKQIVKSHNHGCLLLSANNKEEYFATTVENLACNKEVYDNSDGHYDDINNWVVINFIEKYDILKEK